VHHTLGRHVTDRAAQIDRQGEQLLERKRTVLADQAREMGTLQMFEHDVGSLAVHDRPEASYEQRVREPLQHFGLTTESLARTGVVKQMGAEEFGDDREGQVVIPCEINLVVETPAELLEGIPTRHDLVAGG